MGIIRRKFAGVSAIRRIVLDTDMTVPSKTPIDIPINNPTKTLSAVMADVETTAKVAPQTVRLPP
jgi:hypothetical protein